MACEAIKGPHYVVKKNFRRKLARSSLQEIHVHFLIVELLVHRKFVPAGQTANGNVWCSLEITDNGILHHDNMPGQDASWCGRLA